MRWFASLLALFFFVAGCDYSALEDLQCSRTADCPEEATCRSGFCVIDSSSTNNDTNNALQVASVVVTPASALLTPGDPVTLTASVFNANGDALMDKAITWATSAESVASVDAFGVVTGLAVGVSDVSATVEGISGSAVITVENPVDSIVVTPATLELGLDTESTLVAEAFDARGNSLTRTLTWSSEDVQIATVTSAGLVFGKSVGTVNILASADGVSGVSAVEVKEFPIVSMTIDPATARVRQRSTLSLRAVLLDDRGNEVIGKSVGWTYNPAILGGLASDVDRPDIVVFSAAANQVGSATIRATFEGLMAESIVEVYRPVVATVTLTPLDSTVTVGSLVSFTASVIDEDGLPVTGRTVAWSVDDPSIATIDMNGQVTTLKEGVVAVSAEVDGVIGTTPLTVEGFLLQSVSSGELHSCGVTPAGFGFCWGEGADGRLGTGSTDDQRLPTAIATAMTFDEIDAANEHACGRSGGNIYCWGKRSTGRLGGGNTGGSTSTPELTSGGLSFLQMSTSVDHACAVNDANDIYCWGEGGSGRLGSNSTGDLDVPTLIVPPAAEPLAKWSKVAAGRDHTCAITLAGKLYCWGHNASGELGNGGVVESRVAVPVLTTEVFTDISVGNRFSCGINGAGALYCWGDNSNGKLGISMAVPLSNIPVLVAGLSFSAIDLGNDHACGVSGALGYCWGSGANGRLGTGDTDPKMAPTQIPNSPAFSFISAGAHSCGVANGLAFCFGPNNVGQLGDNSLLERLIPTAVYP
jgi:alpha-tubulin suppressor-like RCC1 family protein/uncharacterized protein YjdB